jgi:hypothetical protein
MPMSALEGLMEAIARLDRSGSILDISGFSRR